jgi:hypothetical protein
VFPRSQLAPHAHGESRPVQFGLLGTTSDHGNVTWWSSNDWIRISGVVLNGLGGFPTTITVPATTGHDHGTIGSFLTLPGFIPPFIGTSQLQVAP